MRMVRKQRGDFSQLHRGIDATIIPRQQERAEARDRRMPQHVPERVVDAEVRRNLHDGHASGIGRPYASSVMLSGSGPPRTPVSSASIAATCSGVSSKSKTSKFSAIRAGLTDFGIAERPSCRCQRSITCAADFPYWRAISSSVGSSKLRFSIPRYDVIPPMGDHACVTMPCSLVHALQRGLLEVWMHFDLIHCGHDGRFAEESIEVLGHEVADTNRAHPAIGEQLLERAIRFKRTVERRR